MNGDSSLGAVGSPIYVKVKYTDSDLPNIKPIPQGNWVDLYAAEDWVYVTGESKILSLGIAMELPAGYEAILAARSSLFKNHGVILTNGIGVIDESYRGDNDIWKASLYALRGGSINKGDRICQFKIVPKMNLDPNSVYAPYFAFVPVAQLGNEDRGGIGSTGI